MFLFSFEPVYFRSKPGPTSADMQEKICRSTGQSVFSIRWPLMKIGRDLRTCISSPAYLFSEGPAATWERRCGWLYASQVRVYSSGMNTTALLPPEQVNPPEAG